MKDKILALLVAKFAGVRKDGLARLASALSLQAATEDEAGTLVEKLTLDRVNEFITDYRKDVDKEVSDSNKTFETNLKKKFDFTEKKTDPNTPPGPADPNDVTSIVKAAVAEALKPLQTELSGFKGQQITGTRLQTLEAKLKDMPENFKAKVIKDFKRMSFESDEAFTEYLADTETDIAAFNQEMADSGLSQQSRPLFGKQTKDGVSSGVQAYIDAKAKPENSLGGKEV